MGQSNWTLRDLEKGRGDRFHGGLGNRYVSTPPAADQGVMHP